MHLFVVEFKNATTAGAAACKRIVFCSRWNSLRREQQQKKKCASLLPNFKFNTTGTLLMNLSRVISAPQRTPSPSVQYTAVRT